MDFSFMKQNEEDFGLREDLFESRMSKCSPEVMIENWLPNPDGMLDSIFSMDFLNNFDVQQTHFGNLDNINDHMKIEAEDYEMSIPTLPDEILPEKDNGISSNSSDSGLSSDNLEAEMSPQYEPSISPTPHTPSGNHSGVKRLSPEIRFSECHEPLTRKIFVKEQTPKVIVQKVPQVTLMSNKLQTNSNTIQIPKQRHQDQEHHTTFQQKTTVNGGRGEIKIVKLAPQMFTNSNNKPVTIQVKNSNTGAKIQAKPGTFFLNKSKLTEMKKLVRVHNSNPRSVLIPVSLHDVKKLKAFKIINPSNIRTINHKVNEMVEVNNNVQVCERKEIIDNKSIKANEDAFIENSSDSESIIIEDGDDSEDYVHDPDAPYPKLILTTEEKRLLSKEGITLPSHYPLTKHEERELKRIRRKIRNKISAQDSRKRKKEYVDGLEERVKQCTEENQTLMKRIKQLQNQNQNLMSQMKKLQSLLTKGTNKTTQPTTCLMVLLLSLALVAAPNLKLGQNVKEGDLEEAVQDTILQNRRNLLFNSKDPNTDIADEDINMSDIISAAEFSTERESGSAKKLTGTKYASSASCRNVRLSYTEFIDDVDDENWYLSSDKAKITEDNILRDSSRNLQTSGFNIENKLKELPEQEYGQNTWLDKDVFEMVSPTFNSLYALNVDKGSTGSFFNLPDTTVVDVTAKQMYASDSGINQNSSEMRQVNKY